MAGSRLEKIGTIYSRMTGLLKAGGIKYSERPIWFDIYQVFPPKYEPHFDREPEIKSEIPIIMYKEDLLRAKFFKKFGLNPYGETRNLVDLSCNEPCQNFVIKYNQLEKENPSWSEETIFETASQGFAISRQPRPDRRFGNRGSSMSKSQSAAVDTAESDEQELNDKRRPKTNLVTAESLLSLFKEAQAEQKKNDSDPDNK